MCRVSLIRFPLTFGRVESANETTGEEKKIIAALLGKLYVSPASSEELTRDLYALVCEAVENGLLTDATSRNSLYKLHVGLGKIVNQLDAAAVAAQMNSAEGQVQRYRRSVSRASSVGLGSVAGAGAGNNAGREGSVVSSRAGSVIKEEDEEEEEATVVLSRTEPVMKSIEEDDAEEDGDDKSLVSELLDEDEEDEGEDTL